MDERARTLSDNDSVPLRTTLVLDANVREMDVSVDDRQIVAPGPLRNLAIECIRIAFSAATVTVEVAKTSVIVPLYVPIQGGHLAQGGPVYPTRPSGRAAAEGRALFLASGDLAASTDGGIHAEEAGAEETDPRLKQMERKKAALEDHASARAPLRSAHARVDTDSACLSSHLPVLCSMRCASRSPSTHAYSIIS